jgi:hypothetical protein
MPIHYDINSELNFILYVCGGLITGSDFFSVAEEAMKDKRRKHGMLVIIDCQAADMVIDLADLHRTIDWMKRTRINHLDVNHIVVLTKSKWLILLRDTLRLMSKSEKFEFDVLHTIDDVVDILELADQKEKVMDFWNSARSLHSMKPWSSHPLSAEMIK